MADNLNFTKTKIEKLGFYEKRSSFPKMQNGGQFKCYQLRKSENWSVTKNENDLKVEILPKLQVTSQNAEQMKFHQNRKWNLKIASKIKIPKNRKSHHKMADH